ncbi:uncharacterized protein LAESUDRAFT_719793 [Laetiporus sulphureus 93-53]|uniref:Uncharacterized protein n=1 Tax=Laetiporus sulphureus 93-53 TaxID=1314785 RepID=A0A165HKM8_9APHY|nr:uncharacterized protein LAESUDRAFT_719793 [Laetiporus sulphureus 93-53]KZT11854.1 hypothetical protein LAESUDRAFT_719793 [Laetiporus sulphureus 93-53]
MADRGYFFLLSHLYRPTTSLTLSTVQTSIAHYLARLTPSPTSLAASVISSPQFLPFSYAKLEALCTSFRHAVHLKVKLFKEEPDGLFSRSIHHRTGEWVKSVLDGLKGGHPTLRLVCAGGLLLGLEDLESDLHAQGGSMRRIVEEEVVLALAEVMDTYSYVQYPADWAKDFKSESEDGEEPLALSLLLASRFLALVSAERLETLPLDMLSDILTSTIESAFQGGCFMSTAQSSCSRDDDGKLVFAPTTPFSRLIQRLSSSKFVASMATLAKLCSRVLSVLSESRPSHGWPAMAQAMAKLERTAKAVEQDWTTSPLAFLPSEDDLAPDTREMIAQLWNILKTQLFTTIMLSQSVLSTVLFVPQPSVDTSPSPYDLAMTVLRTLAHLSFVLHQFGGVTATSEGGFSELKRAFYTALDILSASAPDSERFIAELCGMTSALTSAPQSFVHMKKAYVLACIEQLIPVLNDTCIREQVFPQCLPHLSDVSHRETYESAHSVMLAIFTSYAQKSSQGNTKGVQTSEIPTFAEESVPFYVQCLIENSGDGKLSTIQLRLAYAALVRSASAFRRAQTALSERHTEGDVLARFCIDSLLDAMRNTQGSSDFTSATEKHLQRLHLTLISSVSSVSLSLLPRVLDECKSVIISFSQSGDTSDSEQQPSSLRSELVQALFKEILESVGDAEKEFCVRWWYENREALLGYIASGAPPTSTADSQAVSRL